MPKLACSTSERRAAKKSEACLNPKPIPSSPYEYNWEPCRNEVGSTLDVSVCQFVSWMIAMHAVGNAIACYPDDLFCSRLSNNESMSFLL